MSDDLGPMDITCDAPPYSVVRACAELGLRRPLDVRWQHLEPDEAASRGLLWSPRSTIGHTCRCGKPFPDLRVYTLAADDAPPGEYHVGQCAHCQTIYWQERS